MLYVGCSTPYSTYVLYMGDDVSSLMTQLLRSRVDGSMIAGMVRRPPYVPCLH